MEEENIECKCISQDKNFANLKYKPNPEDHANWFSRLIFAWTNNLISLGYNKKTLEHVDYYEIQEHTKYDYLIAQMSNYKKLNPKTKLVRLLMISGKRVIIMACILSVITATLTILGPIFLKQITQFIIDLIKDSLMNRPLHYGKGYLFSSLLFGAYFLKAFFEQHAQHFNVELLFIIVTQVTGLMFQKTLKMSIQSKKYLDAGKMQNLVLINLVELIVFFSWLFQVMSAPLTIIYATIYIIYELGWVGILGPVMVLIISYLTKIIQSKQVTMRGQCFVFLDERCKKITEFLQGLKIIKYYAWEQFAMDSVKAIRRKELGLIQRFNTNLGLVDVLTQIAPSLISVIIFGIYLAIGKELTASVSFTTLSLLNVIQSPFSSLVSGFNNYINAQVAIERIEHFLSIEEQNDSYAEVDKSQPIHIQMKNAKLSWTSKRTEEDHKKDPDLKKKKYAVKKMQQQQMLEKKAEEAKETKYRQKGDDKLQDVEKQPMSINNQKQGEANQSEAQQQQAQAKAQIDTLKQMEMQVAAQDEQIEKVQLDIEDLYIKKGEFVAVVGQFSSGKTSLLSAILGEMNKLSGKITMNGKISYVTQVPWLCSATIKENIVFGEKYNKQKFEEVVKYCELIQDFETFPGKEETEIGERGLNLSGGQKQRVAIARAVYSDADIYLIDDCLAALDSYVGKKVFYNVFMKYLKGKTIVFVTHALQYLRNFDRILVMNNGKLVEQGVYSQLASNQDSELNKIMVKLKKEKKENQEDEKEEENVEADLGELNLRKESSANPTEQKDAVQPQEANKENEQDKKKKGQLVLREEKVQGRVPFAIYKKYFQLGGYAHLAVVSCVFLIAQSVRVFTDYWVKIWSDRQYDITDAQYTWIYAGISLFSAMLFFSRFVLFVKFTIKVSLKIFEKMWDRVLKAPLQFFDLTPIGRIITRFTSDLNNVDFGLSFQLQYCVFGVLGVIGALAIISIVLPIFLILVALMLIFYSYLLNKFLYAARETRRILDLARAPLIAKFNEASQGLSIIRAFRKQRQFEEQFKQITDNHTRCNYHEQITQRWIGIITGIVSAIVIGAVCYLGIGTLDTNDIKAASRFGLALTWALNISTMLPMSVLLIAQVEVNMNSAYRIFDYTDNVPQERSYYEPAKPYQQWPDKGVYDVKNLKYKYRPELPFVIKGINFDIKSNEKMGVIGRTGSGKSTLTLGLLRILEVFEEQEKGEIVLDGRNIENVGLHYLRSSIGMIPQDPVLFVGTLRSNIDPFDQFKNQEKYLIDIIEKVKLYESVCKKIKEGEEVTDSKVLSVKVEANGENFSQGERQLICLARVLIRKPKVLLMDEATASIDERTDYFIQKMIKTEFPQTTVITIAHRLNTIIQYDRILVLKEGVIEDIDTPVNMLSNPNSYLTKLVKEQGMEFESKMRKLAENKELNLF